MVMKKSSAMKRVGGFTLLEIMVVVGIIVLLAGILLPVLSHVRRQSNIALQKLDFQTIASALEAYHQDFGDYPRNNALTTWTSDRQAPFAPNYEAPPFLSLATALIGPGPANWNVGPQGGIAAGDGATGGGFRGQNSPPFSSGLTTAVPAGSATIQVSTIPPAWTTMTAAQLTDAFALTNVILSPGTDHQEIIGLAPPPVGITTPLAPPYVFGLNFGPINNHPTSPMPPEGAVLFVTAKGKIWPSYLPPDKFKVVFIEVPTSALIPTGSSPNGQPVLLDRWNGVVQYFPRYGPNTNRIYTPQNNPTLPNSSFSPPATLPMAGPLYGYASSQTVYGSAVPVPYGYNAIYDQRDAAPILSSSGAYVTSWAANQTMDLKPLNLGLAIEWMLGDDNLDNLINSSNGANPAERLRYDGNYILISAGPDGPDRTIDTPSLPIYGGFLNIAAMTSTDPASISKAFAASGNIYNFDR